MGFLPINRREMQRLGWEQPDFVYVTGDAYVDHPSFGHAIISRILESHGYKLLYYRSLTGATIMQFMSLANRALVF